MRSHTAGRNIARQKFVNVCTWAHLFQAAPVSVGRTQNLNNFSHTHSQQASPAKCTAKGLEQAAAWPGPVLAPLAATTTTEKAMPVAVLMPQGHVGSLPVLLPLVTLAPVCSRTCWSSAQPQLTPTAVRISSCSRQHALPYATPRARRFQAPFHTYLTTRITRM